MSVMTLREVWPREDRPLTVEDLTRLPDDGNRYELVAGVLEVTAAPLNNHNRVAFRLGFLLGTYCPDGLEVLGPTGVAMAEDHLRIPDVAVVESKWVDAADFVEQPPLLAVEVASRSTRKRDRVTKKREYEAFGIESYWIVEPDAEHPSLVAFELRGGRYEQVALTAENEEFHAVRPFEVTVMPRLLVEPGNAWRPARG